MEEARSNLCKSLNEILNDKHQLSMLPYFIQYMEETKAIHLVQFWFSVEAFRTAASLVTKPDVCSSGYHNNSCSSNNLNAEVCCSCDAGHRAVTMIPSSSQKLLYDKMGDIPREKKLLHSKYHWETSSFMAQKSLCVKSDAIDIYTTYISLNAINNVHIDDTLRQRIEVTICPEDGVVMKDCFDEAQTIVFNEMETRHYPQFCRSRFLSKYQLDYISSGYLIMTDILLNNNALFYFMEFMESQKASVLLHFWSTIENYKTYFKPEGVAINKEEAFNDAMIIYNKYLSLMAADPIEVEDVVRIAVENKMCDEGGATADIFNVPQYLIYDKMNEVYYPLFLQSDQYSKYVSELLYMMESTVDHSSTVRAAHHIIHSAQRQNTTSSSSSCKQQMLDELDDPNELWRRPHSVLRFGYITKYGHFVSEAEPDPTHRSHQGHKLKRSILGREDHSLVKLEQARQQAEKIIKQILTEPPNTHVT